MKSLLLPMIVHKCLASLVVTFTSWLGSDAHRPPHGQRVIRLINCGINPFVE